jgi:hypothetical protein
MIRLAIVIVIACWFPLLAHAENVQPNDHENDDRDHAPALPDCSVAVALPCTERIWADRREVTMTFYDLDVKTNPPTQNFYVVAPQTDTPQGIIPFLHDHVVGDDDGVYWHGYLALCSAEGLSSGACVTSAAEGSLPFARTVNGHLLTTHGPIEAAADSGLVVLVDTGAVLRARVQPCTDHHHHTTSR